MTEFKPKDQHGAATSATGAKKKGGQSRRTKRGDLTAVSNGLDNTSNTTHVGTGPLPEELKPAPRKQWPPFVKLIVYDPDCPTLCSCLQPHCSQHCPAARDLLFRRCTDFSWPDPRITDFDDRFILPKPPWNPDTNSQTGRPEDFNRDPSTRKCIPSINMNLPNKCTASEHKLRAQGEETSTPNPVLSSSLPLDTAKAYAQVVPELGSLLDHMERKEPVLVISTTDSSVDSVLPFQLPPKYGCVVLGFFNVESVEVGSVFPSVRPVFPRF